MASRARKLTAACSLAAFLALGSLMAVRTDASSGGAPTSSGSTQASSGTGASVSTGTYDRDDDGGEYATPATRSSSGGSDTQSHAS